MKWVLFFATLVFGVPLGYQFSLKNSKIENIVFFLMIFFSVQKVSVNFVSMEWLRGTSKGFDVKYPIKLFPQGSFLYFSFFLFSVLSIINSVNLYMSFFEVWTMIKMYFYFWVIHNYINDFKKLDLLIQYIGIAVIYVGLTVLQQKYIMGLWQTRGPFDHQNSMVMFVIIYSSIVLSFILNSKFTKLPFWLIVFGLGTISIVSSFSRAGLIFYMFSIVLIVMVSFFMGLNAQKIAITLLLIVMGIGMVIKSIDSILERFQTASKASGEARVLLAIAATKMANDKVLGIGLNNFGIKIKPPFTYNSHIDFDPEHADQDSRLIIVETVYLLVAAECGWHTLIIYLMMIFYFWSINFYNIIRYRSNKYQFYAIGIAGGLTAVYLQSALEWVMKQPHSFYQIMFIFSLITVMSKLHRREKRKKRSLSIDKQTKIITYDSLR